MNCPLSPAPLSTSAAWLALLALPAAAQGTPDAATPLPEVTVTAERTESVVRRTPVSIGVVDSRELERKAVTQLNDLVGVIAGVTVPNGFSNMPQAVGIRGVGVSLPAMAQAVGLYVDDVPLVRGYATALWDLPDLQRIEVLRGPQGTLYGQNATAGAVKMVSIDPSADPNAWLSAGAGNHGAFELRGYANGALGGGPLSGSIAFSRRVNDGYGRNAALGIDINRLDATQFRTKLRWAVADTSSAVLAVDGLRDRSDTNTLNYPLNHPQGTPRVSYTTATSGPFKRDAGGVSLKVEGQPAPGITLKSITAFRAYKDDTVADFGGLEVQRYGIDQVIEQQAFSQELQVQGRDAHRTWSAGAVVVSDRFDFERFTVSFPLASVSPSHAEARTHQRTTDLGVYGQGRQAVGDRTGVTGGLRLYRTEQTGSNGYWRTDAQQQRTAQVYQADDLATSKTGLVPRLGVDHQWSPDVFLYASVAQGAKFGGFNRAAESETSARMATSPERVTAWELGSKSRHAGGRVSANVALFYNDYRDYLAALNNTVVNGVTVTDAVLTNAGKARTYGIDLDLAAKVTDRIEWRASVELLKSRFAAFANPTGAASSDYVGHELPYAPRLSLGSTVAYHHPLASGAAIDVDAWVQYQRQQYSDVANNAQLQVPAQTYVNLGTAYTDAARHWTFSLRVRNLFDKTHAVLRTRIPPLGVDAAYYNPPRTLVFTARYDL